MKTFLPTQWRMRTLPLVLTLLSVQASACLNDRDTQRREHAWSAESQPMSVEEGPVVDYVGAAKWPVVVLAGMVGSLFAVDRAFKRKRR
ncbi:hypothetical protein EON79_03335 [bacterium]|nr:MAG: hypothetical protein EON79_03335 [bacterium]